MGSPAGWRASGNIRPRHFYDGAGASSHLRDRPAGWVTNATLYALAYVPYIHLIVLIATIVLSITMVSRIEKMSVGTARGIFIAFSALFGFTMSMYLYIFEFGSLIFVFLATALISRCWLPTAILPRQT